MRRTPAFALALASLALVACGGSEPPPDHADEAPARAEAHPGGEPGGRGWGPPEIANRPATGGAPSAPNAPAEAVPAEPAEPFDPAHPTAAGMRWTAPASFAFHTPESEMRRAEYVVGRAGDADVTMTVFHFPGMGGGIDANVTRWLGQFTQPDGRSTLSVARVGTQMAGALRVTTVDVTGHFEGGTMGGGNGDDYRMLAAIAEAPRGPVFFKLVGPRSVVDASEAGFRELVASFALAN